LQRSTGHYFKSNSNGNCGSDLYLYSGGIPQARPMVLGHEFMRIIEETGRAVTNLKRGDRVVAPFPIACVTCFFCNHELPGQCENSNSENYGPEGGLLTQKGRPLFGYTDLYGSYDGSQAEYVWDPYGDYGPRLVPENLANEQIFFLTYISIAKRFCGMKMQKRL
jgi:threonine dehydrogenase-like Zn-dependent dehydrogenase